MVNDLRKLMRENVAAPPPDDLDLGGVMSAGRRRTRVRRRLAVGVAALTLVAVAATSALVLPLSSDPEGADRNDAAARGTAPAPDAPTITLADAEPAVDGRDYEVLTSYTNENLDRDNGQYLEGSTDDGLVLFRDGPRLGQQHPRYALLDPATDERDWLPRSSIGQAQAWPVELTEERLVLLSNDEGDVTGPDDLPMVAHVFDRGTRAWTTIAWPDLPAVGFPTGDVGPDGRLYVPVPATRGAVPEGGWPTGSDGEADDSDAPGDTHRLWSVSLTDGTDVRDEDLTVGDVAFTETAMVWTDSTNGDAGQVHVRDLGSGEETSFDPRTAERCNLLGLGASGDRIVMSQYCGDYADGRDDRVQVLTTDGEQVVTLQDDGAEGWLPAGSDVVNVTVFGGRGDERSGTYAYDLRTDRFLRISDSISSFGLGGPTGHARQLLWHTPVNNLRGATQHLGQLTD